jgi:hypothetical protein
MCLSACQKAQRGSLDHLWYALWLKLHRMGLSVVFMCWSNCGMPSDHLWDTVLIVHSMTLEDDNR